MDETVNRAQKAPAQLGDPRPPIAPKARRRRGWTPLAVLVVLAVAAYFVHRETSAPSGGRGRGGSPPQSVRTAAATNGDMPLTLDALGTVTSLDTVSVLTQVAGKLLSVGFTEGKVVKQGDPIAQIDPAPFQASLDQAQAALAKDLASLAQAQADLARYQVLIKQDSISKQQVQDQQFLVQQDQAAVAVDKANIDTANLSLTYAKIVSPINGLAGLLQVDVGNYLQPSSAAPIVTIAQIEPISVIFAIPQQDLPQIQARLRAGAQLQVTALDQVDSHPLATGVLSAVDSQISTTTGTVNLKAIFPNADDVLFPNQFVNTRLLIDTVKGAVLVPSQAVQHGSPGAFVYLVQPDGVVKVQTVQTGASDATNTVVTSGLSVGQNVVIDGADRLTDGAHVVVRNATPSQAAAGSQAGAQSSGGQSGRRTTGAKRPAGAPAAGSAPAGAPSAASAAPASAAPASAAPASGSQP